MADDMAETPSTRPNPDPTVATNDAVKRAVDAERDYVNGRVDVLNERLNGIDRATVVLNETVNRVPTDLQEGLGHLQAVMDERFTSIGTQFQERDTRSERESRDNKVAVDAAFAAQKEAASEQNKSNTLAITKSEEQTKETINKLAELVTSQIGSQSEKIDDLKDRVNRIESVRVGASEQRADTHQTLTGVQAFVAIAAALIVAGGLFLGIHNSSHTCFNQAGAQIACR